MSLRVSDTGALVSEGGRSLMPGVEALTTQAIEALGLRCLKTQKGRMIAIEKAALPLRDNAAVVPISIYGRLSST